MMDSFNLNSPSVGLMPMDLSPFDTQDSTFLHMQMDDFSLTPVYSIAPFHRSTPSSPSSSPGPFLRRPTTSTSVCGSSLFVSPSEADADFDESALTINPMPPLFDESGLLFPSPQATTTTTTTTSCSPMTSPMSPSHMSSSSLLSEDDGSIDFSDTSSVSSSLDGTFPQFSHSENRDFDLSFPHLDAYTLPTDPVSSPLSFDGELGAAPPSPFDSPLDSSTPPSPSSTLVSSEEVFAYPSISVLELQRELAEAASRASSPSYITTSAPASPSSSSSSSSAPTTRTSTRARAFPRRFVESTSGTEVDFSSEEVKVEEVVATTTATPRRGRARSVTREPATRPKSRKSRSAATAAARAIAHTAREETKSSSPSSSSHDDDDDDDDNDNDDGSPHPKKRRRKNSAGSSSSASASSSKPRAPERVPLPPTGVTLSRETLLTITHASYEQFVVEVRASRKLSSEHEKEIKRQRRLVKNRESAHASRERKKEEMDGLNNASKGLRQDNARLKTQMTQLEAENRALKEQLSQMTSTIRRSPDLSKMWEVIRSATTVVTSKEQTKKLTNAGVCLLIVLFAFGIFFQVGPSTSAGFSSPGGPALPFENYVSPHIPRVVPDHLSSSRHSHGHSLSSSSSSSSSRYSRSEERRVGKECRSRWSPYH
eukprot:TRINITY_DN5551_c0_g3_i3.p1 TRINITY_DN5551_c0_g3~~TRINITY_DN5551_c0_g3_i3.p1  ORF type:complete len:655 (+),score=220.39 TRINITY_DN5551_c0_g3_i3:217-2181(+)